MNKTPVAAALSIIFAAQLSSMAQAQAGVPALNGHLASVSKNTFYGLTDDHTVQDVQILNNTIKHKINDNLTIQNPTQFAHYVIDAQETAAHALLTGPLATRSALPAA